MAKVLAMVLAGGEGTRLHPLTVDRAKPSVPFGARYRIIDFVLSNLINSGFFQIKVLTQFKSNSLIRHISMAWQLSAHLGHYVDVVPAQMQIGRFWYRGTADAVFQNLNLIRDENPNEVLVFGGDHIYKMNIRQMLEFHREKGADLTVAAIPVPIAEASNFGIIEVDDQWRMVGFEEKPANPKPMPGDPGRALASMGNYIFKRDPLVQEISQNAQLETNHDFGRNIIPGMLGRYRIFVYDFSRNEIPGMEETERGYWRDVGDLDSYFQANMDLASVLPRLNLYNYQWPIRSFYPAYPPAKFVFAGGEADRIGIATDSVVAEGCIISGGRINRCILFPRVRINSYAWVTDSILMEGVEIGRHCQIQRAIIDKGVEIPSGVRIGFDRNADEARFHISDKGIVVIPKGYRF